MIYRRVVNGAIDGTFFGTGGARVGISFIPANKLHLYSIYPQIEPNYDPTTETTSDLFFDTDINIVTRKVYDFEKGIRHNWKAADFTLDGDLIRKYRVRAVRDDTFKGKSLETLADKALKSQAPYFLVDQDGTLNPDGDYMEVYLSSIDPSDLAGLNGYINSTPGTVLDNYDELI